MQNGRRELAPVAVNALHYFRSWIALGKRSTLAEVKSLPSFHEPTSKKWAAPSLRMPLSLHQLVKLKGQLPVPPTFVPRASGEISRRSVNLRTLSLGGLN